MKYVCELCGLVYDEEKGYPQRNIAPGTLFADLPENFECPGCFSDRRSFYPVRPREASSAVGQSVSPTGAYTGDKYESER